LQVSDLNQARLQGQQAEHAHVPERLSSLGIRAATIQ